ncbi:acyl-CoA dehydrogenase family protein [Pseudonocardia alni]|uniref:acyl-CoA dehydrogenase family protein n=1 Tax=Pseudonocardia alni TaxID=33907 RepID=UPI00280B5348|nr:acyl-CoA dehydrogenase family protein [Pseudonocardia alni]
MTISVDSPNLLARVREVVPVLAAHAAQTEEQGRVAAASLDAARAAGALSMLVPHSHRGAGAGTRTAVEVITELGRGCPSTAWVAATNADAHILLDVFVPDSARDEVRADPDAVLCGAGQPVGRAEAVTGGIRLSGRWPYLSGCESARWAMVTAVVGEQPAWVLVPAEELDIERSWDVAGLQGTGSHTGVADALFVPDAHWFPVAVTAQGAPDLSADPVMGERSALMLLAAMVGAAQGAHDLVAATMHRRRPPLSAHPSLVASPGARDHFARASLVLDTARRRTLEVADTVDRVRAGTTLPATEPARLRIEMAQAARECRAATELLLDLHGSSGFRSDNPLQRFWRDLSVGSRHAHFTSYLAVENYGDVLAASLRDDLSQRSST